MNYISTYRKDNTNITIGNKNPIKSWTVGVDVEEEAQKQLNNVANMPFIHKHLAVMPDCHWGKGATVGSVIPTYKAIIPAAVGVDLGCVDAETEYLTPTGWKRIADYSEGDQVLIFDPESENAFFEQSTFIKLPCKNFWSIKTKYGVNQVLSDEHKVIYYESEKFHTIKAEDLAKKHNESIFGFKGKFLTTFNLKRDSNLNLTDSQIRMMVMAMVRSCFGFIVKNSEYSLFLENNEEVKRAKKLLEESNIEFNSFPNEYCLMFYMPENLNDPNKFWNASPEQLKIICDEALHWSKRNIAFRTCSKDLADFMSYAFSACGKRAVVVGSNRIFDYKVYIHNNPKVGISGIFNKIKRVPSVDGYKYCFNTSTGYWIIRRGGVIAATGNCGIYATKTSLTASMLPENLKDLRGAIEKAVPHGRTDNGGKNDRGAWGEPPAEVNIAWMGLEPVYKKLIEKYPKIKHHMEQKQLGTLGTSNHFLEVCLDEEDSVWLMVHSGSRGIGNKIGSFFISKAKEEMERFFIHLPDSNLAYLPQGSQYFEDYIKAVNWAQDLARVNREVMIDSAIKALKASNLLPKFYVTDEAINCHHNYIAKELHYGKNVWITRKGAIRAKENDLGVIPGSMGAKSFIVRGKGNAESFHSCSHGAGRKMSRTEAKKKFSLEDHEKATQGVECKKDSSVIDETPGAYKDIEAVMKAQDDLVETVHTLKQIVCVKG